MADKIDFAESKSSQGGNSGNQTPLVEEEDDGFMDIPDGIDDELPFN